MVNGYVTPVLPHSTTGPSVSSRGSRRCSDSSRSDPSDETYHPNDPSFEPIRDRDLVKRLFEEDEDEGQRNDSSPL